MTHRRKRRAKHTVGLHDHERAAIDIAARGVERTRARYMREAALAFAVLLADPELGAEAFGLLARVKAPEARARLAVGVWRDLCAAVENGGDDE